METRGTGKKCPRYQLRAVAVRIEPWVQHLFSLSLHPGTRYLPEPRFHNL